MRTRWKKVKVFITLLIIIATMFLTVDALRSRSYEGTVLNFPVGSNSISLSNPSEPVQVRLAGTGGRFFRVSSTIEALSGISSSQGSENGTIQVFEFILPQGSSEFRVIGNSAIHFISDTTNSLHASVYVSLESFYTSILVAGFIILLALFYLSFVFEHGWIRLFRPVDKLGQDIQLLAGDK